MSVLKHKTHLPRPHSSFFACMIIERSPPNMIAIGHLLRPHYIGKNTRCQYTSLLSMIFEVYEHRRGDSPIQLYIPLRVTINHVHYVTKINQAFPFFLACVEKAGIRPGYEATLKKPREEMLLLFVHSHKPTFLCLYHNNTQL